MLNIKVVENKKNIKSLGLDLIDDCEVGFKYINGISEKSKILMKLIDKADYVDDTTITDRFGDKTFIDNLSTGCKTAICVVEYPDKWINTMECGLNALNAILTTCDEGNIILLDTGWDIPKTFGSEITVSINGKIFNKISDLNEYIRDGEYDV